MKTRNFLPLTAVTLATGLALAGCSTNTPGSSGTSMPGMDHGNIGSSAASTAATGEHNSADAMFAQMMIPHHSQAVEMSGMILKKNDIPATVSALATRIKDAQAPEIEKMTGWLKTWNEPTTMAGGHSMSGHNMDGMMDADDMAKLEAAQGTEAAKLFLTQMIVHHQGAVTMAKTEITDGKSPDTVQLAKDIVAAQEAEVKEMQQLLTTL